MGKGNQVIFKIYGVIIVSLGSIEKFISFSIRLVRFGDFIRLRILGFRDAVSSRCGGGGNREFFSLVRFTSRFRAWSRSNCLLLSIFIFRMAPRE